MSSPDRIPPESALMTPEQQNAFYVDPAHQVPQGPLVRRRSTRVEPSEPVRVRFPEDLRQQVLDRAAADDRSVPDWIRRAVEHELPRSS